MYNIRDLMILDDFQVKNMIFIRENFQDHSVDKLLCKFVF